MSSFGIGTAESTSEMSVVVGYFVLAVSVDACPSWFVVAVDGVGIWSITCAEFDGSTMADDGVGDGLNVSVWSV